MKPLVDALSRIDTSPVRWMDRPQHELLAIDWALPTPAQCRDREAVPA